MSKNRRFQLILVVAVLLSTCWNVHAENAPESIKKHAVPVSDKVKALLDPMEIKDMVQDAYFLKTLGDILSRSDFSETDKVDAFYLMLKKIRWSFPGAVYIPPKSDYFSTFTGYARTFFLYQKMLNELHYDVTPLLALARNQTAENVMRSSHALLLAALLDPAAVKQFLPPFLTSKAIEKAQVPDIFLHYLSLSVVLARDHSLAKRLGKLLPAVSSEEGKEDILCCLGIFSSTGIKIIQDFLMDDNRKEYDQAVETAICILKRRLSEKEFNEFFEKLISRHPQLKSRLEDLKNNDFKSSFARKGQGWIKIWDGFDVVVFDDGKLISHGKTFREFME